MEVKDIMTCSVVSIHPNESVEVAARTMTQYNIGILPVCDGGGKLCGRLQMEDSVVAEQHFLPVHIEHSQRLLKLRLRHIGPVVKEAPVKDDQDPGSGILVRDVSGSALKHPLLFQLHLLNHLLHLQLRRHHLLLLLL